MMFCFTTGQKATESADHGLEILAWCWWLTPIILAIQKAAIRRVKVGRQRAKKVHETLSRKLLHKNRAGGVAQGESPEFKPQYSQKKEKKNS
jgi:hypothetical protein